MALHTKRTSYEAAELLRLAGIVDPDALLKAAADEPGSEHEGHNGTTYVWVWYSAIRSRFTVDICADHDTDYGCCDHCGRWADAL